MDISKELRAVGLDPRSFSEGDLIARSPIDGSTTVKLRTHDSATVDAAIGRAHATHRALAAAS